MTLRSLAFAAGTSFLTLIFVDSGAADSDSDISIISQYVVSQRHWPAKAFRIERKDCDCSYALYQVTYLSEVDKPLTANSQSSAVHYDEQLHPVVKKAQFQ